MAEASAKRVTGDTPQGTMGRVQTAGEATSRPLSPSRLPLRAYRERRLGTRQTEGRVYSDNDLLILYNGENEKVVFLNCFAADNALLIRDPV